MYRRTSYILLPGKTMHPVMQVLVGLVGLGLTAVLFMLGLVFFAVLAGIAAVGGLALYARLWWLRRKAQKANPEGVQRERPRRAPRSAHETIEGEYEVVDEHERR